MCANSQRRLVQLWIRGSAEPARTSCLALQTMYKIGPILAEIGEASRFRRGEQITRLVGLDPVVDESGETRRRGHLAKAGSPHLRWALVEPPCMRTDVEHLTSPTTGRRAPVATPPSLASPSHARSASASTTRSATSSSQQRPDLTALTRSVLHLSRRCRLLKWNEPSPFAFPTRQPARDHRAPR